MYAVSMYSAVLSLHSWLRWAVLVAGLVAWVRSVSGPASAWSRVDDRAGFWFVMTLDLQLTIGLILYFFLSPYTTAALRDLGGAMKDSTLRFWAVEHGFGMLIGVALAHVGRVRARKGDARHRRRTTAIFVGLALVAIAISIPWPGLGAHGRPLLRW